MTDHFLTLDSLGRDGVREILDLSHRFKREPGRHRGALDGGRVGMIFDKPSTRTRVSLEDAAWALGHAPDRPATRRAPARPRGDRRGHRARPFALPVGAHDPDLRPGPGGGARGPLQHPDHQRPDRRAPSVPGARRRDDAGGGPGQPRGPAGRLRRGRQQRGPLADPGRRVPGVRAGDRHAGGLPARPGHRGGRPGPGRGHRWRGRAVHRAGRRRARCGRRLHGRLGVDGQGSRAGGAPAGSSPGTRWTRP